MIVFYTCTCNKQYRQFYRELLSLYFETFDNFPQHRWRGAWLLVKKWYIGVAC